MSYTVLISYNHRDKDTVKKIQKSIENAGHKVEIDDQFLVASDELIPSIKVKIQQSDFIAVCLSENSIKKSEWVSREIHEVLRSELKTKKSKLLLCKISDCKFPDALSMLQKYERLYIDFVPDFDKATDRVIERINMGVRPVFQRVNYLTLDIAARDLDIYLTGDAFGWEALPQLKYYEALDSYVVFGFKKDSSTEFKHFAICTTKDLGRVRSCIQHAGYVVTGNGGRDNEPGKRRLWFLRPDYPVTLGFDNVHSNNRWK